MRIPVLLVTVLGLTLSCGNSGAPGEPTTGGSGGTGNSSNGGSSTGGSSTGGSSTGGSSTGGSGGCDPNSGGIGGYPPRCDHGTYSSATPCSVTTYCTGDTPLCTVAGCRACPVAGGTPLVSIGDACVDVTEVTRAQYEEWLALSPPTDLQFPACEGNLSFEADATCMSGADVCAGDCGAHPQVCIDWCDAYAYCLFVGKRLCSGGKYSPELPFACDEGTGRGYPYGDEYVAEACNGSDSGAGTTVPAGSVAACRAAHAAGNIYDLTGNVWEWDDSCSNDPDAAAPCEARGGSYLEPGSSNTCAAVTTMLRRDSLAANLGFRCCAP